MDKNDSGEEFDNKILLFVKFYNCDLDVINCLLK